MRKYEYLFPEVNFTKEGDSWPGEFEMVNSIVQEGFRIVGSTVIPLERGSHMVIFHMEREVVE